MIGILGDVNVESRFQSVLHGCNSAILGWQKNIYLIKIIELVTERQL